MAPRQEPVGGTPVLTMCEEGDGGEGQGLLTSGAIQGGGQQSERRLQQKCGRSTPCAQH